jgi:hypothetical protein
MKPTLGKWFWAEWLGTNLVYVLGHPWFDLGDGPGLRSFAVCVALFLLPGAAGFDFSSIARRQAPDGSSQNPPICWAFAAWLALVLLTSIAFQVSTLVVLLTLRIPVTPNLVWNVAWLATNLLFFARSQTRKKCNREVGTDLVKRSTVALLGLIYLAAYLLYAWGATRVVPAQDDQDLEVQGTAYALVHRLEPLLVTDRATVYYFAHPPLLHIYVGLYFLYTNQLNELKYYEDASLRALQATEGTLPPRVAIGDEVGSFKIVGREGLNYLVTVIRADPWWRPVGQRLTISYLDLEWERIRSQYNQSPALWPTRAPTVFLAALTVSLLALWSFEATRSWLIAVAVALAYATSPEVFVRSSYGGYFGISNIAVVLMLCVSSIGRADATKSRAAFASGMFSALANHKDVFLPFAFALWELIRPDSEGWRHRIRRSATQPTALGFAAGTGLFWLYGLSTHPVGFWQDQVHNHLFDRFAHYNPLGYGGYPSVGALWLELTQHTGYVLIPIAIVLLAMTITNGTTTNGRFTSKLNVPQPTGAWLLWLAITAIAFSWVDWRMTKHLMPILPALYLAPALWVGRRSNSASVVLVLYGWLVIFNGYWVERIASNFWSFPVTPGW